MKQYTLDWTRYEELARQAVAEGVVLVKNEQKTLPLQSGTKLAVFGRSQFHYYKSGTGSGGMVNVGHVTTPLEALREHPDIHINESLYATYEEWVKENPFDQGVGWAGEPWSQQEMDVTDELVEQATQESDVALIMIGRTAGEDRDNTAERGSFLLTDIEHTMIERVTKRFDKTVVVLNVGNIIDMKWAKEPSAILYAWQGGMEGGKGLVDVLGFEDEMNQQDTFELDYQHLENGEHVDLSGIDTSTGHTHVFAISVDQTGTYDITLTARSNAGELAQMPVTLFANNIPGATFTFNRTDGEWVMQTKQVFFLNQHNYLQLYFALSGLEVKDVSFTLADEFSMKNG